MLLIHRRLLFSQVRIGHIYGHSGVLQECLIDDLRVAQQEHRRLGSWRLVTQTTYRVTTFDVTYWVIHLGL